MNKLAGFGVDLSEYEKNIILTDIGISNLLDLEEKYRCKLIPNSNKKTLCVLTKFDNLKKIKE